eukprot:gene6745-4838_t
MADIATVEHMYSIPDSLSPVGNDRLESSLKASDWSAADSLDNSSPSQRPGATVSNGSPAGSPTNSFEEAAPERERQHVVQAEAAADVEEGEEGEAAATGSVGSDASSSSSSSATSGSSFDAERELVEYWNTSFIVNTLASHFPEKHEYNSPATPTFFPSSRHHRFFPGTTSLDEEDERELDCQSEEIEGEGQEVPAAEAKSCAATAAASRSASAPASEVRQSRKPAPATPGTPELDGSDASKMSTNASASMSSADSHHSRVRVQNFVAYPPEDAKTTKQRNLLCWGPPLPLYTIMDIPYWQTYNPAIRGSYRAFYDTGMTFKSFLGWHNETVNVWTHFAGFVLFACLTVLLAKSVLRPYDGQLALFHLGNATVFYYVFCFGCMCCTCCSAVYHLFTGHRDCQLMTLMGRIDFVGITTLIIGSFLPPLYVLMHCFPTLRRMYLGAAILLGIATSIACWTNIFFEHVGLRVGMFVGLAISGVAPLIHTLWLVPFTTALGSILYGIWLMLILYGVGVVFYVTRFPEAWFPSHFDCFLSSHQLWHYFVLLAAMVHFFNCASMYQMYTMSGANC